MTQSWSPLSVSAVGEYIVGNIFLARKSCLHSGTASFRYSGHSWTLLTHTIANTHYGDCCKPAWFSHYKQHTDLNRLRGTCSFLQLDQWVSQSAQHSTEDHHAQTGDKTQMELWTDRCQETNQLTFALTNWEDHLTQTYNNLEVRIYSTERSSRSNTDQNHQNQEARQGEHR